MADLTTPRPTVWEYLLVHYPEDKTKKPFIIGPPLCILATSEANAGKLAARAIPEDFASNLDEVTIVIRPF